MVEYAPWIPVVFAMQLVVFYFGKLREENADLMLIKLSNLWRRWFKAPGRPFSYSIT